VEVSGHLHSPAALPPEKCPETRWIGGWVAPRAGLDVVVKGNDKCPALSGIEPQLSFP